jgi:hypothetical protein
MPVDSSLLGNTNNTFQNTSNNEVLNKGCDSNRNLLQGSPLQGGGGYSNTFKSLEQDSNNNMGRGYTSSEKYSDCNKQGGGAAELGTESHATNRFNHSFSGGYGFGKEGAAVAHELKGSYAAMTQNKDMNSCSGGRKRRRKSRKKCNCKGKCHCKGKCKCKGKCNCKGRLKTRRKSRKRKPKRKSRKRKPKRKSRKRKPKRKSRKRKPKRKSRKRKSRNRAQKGGSSISYSAIDTGLTGNDARILGTNASLSSDANCGDGYNHYTGGSEKTLY